MAPAEKKHYTTKPEDRVSKVEKGAFAMAGITFNVGISGLQQLVYPIYNLTLGVSPTLIGIVLAVLRLWDAITDPFMGNLSDNTQSRWGRRKPYILGGVILCAVLFPVIWFVPVDWPENAKAIYLLVTSLFFFTAFTIFNVPWLSLGYELSPDYHERTRIWAWRALVSKVATILMGYSYLISQWDAFNDTMEGVRVVGIAFGGLMLVLTLPSIFICKERFKHTAEPQVKMRLVDAVRETFKNRAFLRLVAVIALMLSGTIMVSSMGIYVTSYHVFDGDTVKGALYSGNALLVYAICGMISVPFATALATRFGKNTVVSWSLLTGAVASGLKFLLYTPDHPWLVLVHPVLLAPTFSAFWVLIDPMKADLADYDESKTGRRREGMYASMANWFEKLAVTVTLVSSGFLIDLSGFDVELGSAQDPDAIYLMRVFFAFVPTIALLLGWLIIQNYPLTEQRMYEIRQELEARRGPSNALTDD